LADAFRVLCLDAERVLETCVPDTGLPPRAFTFVEGEEFDMEPGARRDVAPDMLMIAV